jgi:hypothetical protein
MTSAPLLRRMAGAVAVAALGVGVLAGCAAGQIAQTADQIANLDGAQGTVGEVGVMNALLATPDGADYPKGSKAPLMLWVSNDSDTPDTLTGITTDAGTVTISGTATVPGQSVIQIGGSDAKITATVTDLTRALRYGISVPMTFSFAHAGDLQLNVPIEIPEQRASGRATTDIYPSEAPNLWDTEASEAPSTNQPAPTTSSPAEERPTAPPPFYTGTAHNTPAITG